MSRCIEDTDGILDLTLSQIGLFLATGILLVAVLSMVFYSDWQNTAEIELYATRFSTLLQDVDNRIIENTTRFQFPQKNYGYTVRLSTEYIVISRSGYWDATLAVKQRFLIRPWIRSSLGNWTTGTDLHEYLNFTFGHQGIQNDPLSSADFMNFTRELNTTVYFFALHPFEVIIQEPVFVEKVTIFSDDEQPYDFLLVYQ